MQILIPLTSRKNRFTYFIFQFSSFKFPTYTNLNNGHRCVGSKKLWWQGIRTQGILLDIVNCLQLKLQVLHISPNYLKMQSTVLLKWDESSSNKTSNEYEHCFEADKYAFETY